jgi:four helix bundle protein
MPTAAFSVSCLLFAISSCYLLFAICPKEKPAGFWCNEHRGDYWVAHASTDISATKQKMADFRKLRVWQKANALSVATAQAVEGLTGNTASILRSQLLRSVFSIQANIAEGSSKRSDREFARYVRIALGSSTESANHLILMHDLKMLGDPTFAALDSKLEIVGKMLSGLEKRLRGDADDEISSG